MTRTPAQEYVLKLYRIERHRADDATAARLVVGHLAEHLADDMLAGYGIAATLRDAYRVAKQWQALTRLRPYVRLADLGRAA